ncbi:MAG: hypothetical protein IJ080_03030 [Oscillospiraceae bacterium]|nr:hypothetical protein [Oscillospiraceae bacterium]MBQ8978718.1 hypothetical protein [Oscillospiraceae bacterium]
MKKKRIAALAAAVIALQTMSAVVSAVPYGTYYYVNGVYFTDPFDAQAAGHGYMYTSTTNVPSNVVAVYYSSNTGKYYNSESAAVADGGSDYTVAYRAPDANIAVVGTTYYNWSNAYSSAYPYYSTYTGRYYPTYQEAYAASLFNSSYVVSGSNTTNGWYNSYTNRYYNTYDAAVAAGGGSAYVYWRGTTVATTPTNVRSGLYYVTSTETYFPNYASAYAAANGDTSKMQYVGYIADETARAVGTYYSSKTKKYYPNFASALYASDYDKDAVVPVGGNTTTPANQGYYYYNGKWYYNGVASTNNVLQDPYLSYQNTITNRNKTTTTTSSTAAEPQAGTPYINGGKSYQGTNGILRYLQRYAKIGDTIYVKMNGATTVDAEILKWIKGYDLNLVFVLGNGARWTINGNDVKGQPKSMSIVTEYNIKYIPADVSKSVKAAAVSTAQVGLGNTFGALQVPADVSLKLSKKRAGYSATLYYYNKDTGALNAVGTTTINSSGYATFSIIEGGAYLVAIN